MTSDWFSPILVKELRQGMRARVFEGSFVMLQVLMVLTMLGIIIAAQNSTNSFTRGFAMGSFWSMVSIPVLFIMPLRGCGALRNEMEQKTLELMFLTRLSAWRIVFGKWAALFAQTCLMVCAILPYVVMRYFVGGVELAAELQGVCAMLVTSGLLLGITVALSSFESRLVRGISYFLPFGLAWSGLVSIAGFAGMSGSSVSGGVLATGLLYYCIFALVILLYCFELGASRIGPAAENHETRKRLLALVVLLLGPVLRLFGVDDVIFVLCFFLVLPACVDAVCRPWRNLPVHYVPFLKLKFFRRPISWVLMPGWSSGVLFTLLVFAVSLLCFALGTDMLDDFILVLALFLALILLPLALVSNDVMRGDHLSTTYLGVQMGVLSLSAILFFLLGLIDSVGRINVGWLDDEVMWTVIFLVIAGLSLFAILVRRGVFWRELWGIEERAIALRNHLQEQEEA